MLKNAIIEWLNTPIAIIEFAQLEHPLASSRADPVNVLLVLFQRQSPSQRPG
jgi:hypothetical protein